jgi:hypothetical protein
VNCRKAALRVVALLFQSLLLAACSLNSNVRGQGLVVFVNNSLTAISNQVTLGRIPAGPSFVVGLYYLSETNGVASSDWTLLAKTNCILPGIFAGGQRPVNVPDDLSLSFQVRAWGSTVLSTIPSTYEEAVATGDARFLVGASDVLQITFTNRIVALTTAGLKSLSVFPVGLTPITNQPPRFRKGLDVNVRADSGEQQFPNWATEVDAGLGETNQVLMFSLTNNHPQFFVAQPNISIDGTLSFIPQPEAWGIATVSVILTDDGGVAFGGIDRSDMQQFTIKICPRWLGLTNQQPTFVKGSDQKLIENSPRQVISNWATEINVGFCEEPAQTAEFEVVIDRPELFLELPRIAPDGTLSYAVASNAVGTVTATVVLKDNGGTNNDGRNTSDPQTLELEICRYKIPVVNTNDAGTGSFRAAIEEANSCPGVNAIRVEFSDTNSDLYIIAPASPLPSIIDPVEISGGIRPSQLDGSIIELKGTGLTSGSGLKILCGNSQVSGLIIHSFPESGIHLENGGTNRIQGNWIGHDATGSFRRTGNRAYGIHIINSRNNIIGGTNPPDPNVIARNLQGELRLALPGSRGNQLLGNWVGVYSSSEFLQFPSTAPGLILEFGADGNLIGGNTVEAGNSFGFTTNAALVVGSSHNVFRGNYIGVYKDGASPANPYLQYPQMQNAEGVLPADVLPALKKQNPKRRGAPRF